MRAGGLRWVTERRLATDWHRGQCALGVGKEGVGEPLRRAEPFLDALWQGLLHNANQLARRLGIETAQIWRACVDLLVEHGDGRRANEGGPARQRLVEHAAKRIDVGARVDLP